MSFVKACSLSDLHQGRALGVQVGDERVAIVRDGDTLYAIQDVCSHASILLSEGDYDPETQSLECVGHGSRFQLTDGVPMEPPAIRPNDIYPTRIEGDDVLVDLDNPLQER